MTLQKDQPKPPENRTQKIVKWSVIGVAAVLLIVSITLLITSGARFF